jgi:hypothetical protein
MRGCVCVVPKILERVPLGKHVHFYVFSCPNGFIASLLPLLLGLLPGGANQFPGGTFTRCGPAPFHGARSKWSMDLRAGEYYSAFAQKGHSSIINRKVTAFPFQNRCAHATKQLLKEKPKPTQVKR